jgi:hypothetical protein
MKTKISNRAAKALSRTNSKSIALRALILFAAQNPGFEWANYATGNWAESARAYRGDSRPVSRQWQKILALLWATDAVTDEDMVAASERAFSGRLSFVRRGDGWGVGYCAGQYWPTEYRAASGAVLETAVRIARERVANAA